jgi:hypothetical protein
MITGCGSETVAVVAPQFMIQAPSKGGAKMDQTIEPSSVVVRGSATGLAQEIAVGRHRLLADEPVSGGGTDTGPDPYGLLLAALGA